MPTVFDVRKAEMIVPFVLLEKHHFYHWLFTKEETRTVTKVKEDWRDPGIISNLVSAHDEAYKPSILR